ncbi:hypothetical protein ACHAXR_010206 [Thalassiosira sp. AJA248-18]
MLFARQVDKWEELVTFYDSQVNGSVDYGVEFERLGSIIKRSKSAFRWSFLVKREAETASQFVWGQLRKRILATVTTFIIPQILVFLARDTGVEDAFNTWANRTSFAFTPPPTSAPSSAYTGRPVARDDDCTIAMDDIAYINVLDNDTPATGQTLQIQSIMIDGKNGQCRMSGDSVSLAYFPNLDYTGMDSCVYEACDSFPKCDIATMTVEVVTLFPPAQLSPLTPFPTEATDPLKTPFPTETTDPPTLFPTLPPPAIPFPTPAHFTTPTPTLGSTFFQGRPVARDDTIAIDDGIDDINVLVLDNDTPATGQTLRVQAIMVDGKNGQCYVGIDLVSLFYVPNPGFTGTDSCVYKTCDSVPRCDSATMTVEVVTSFPITPFPTET